MPTPALKEAVELKYYWSDDEEIIRSEAFDTREQAYSDAYCHRAQCFDDPSQNDGFFLHHGKMVANPDYDAYYAKHYGVFDEDNAKFLFEGKTERVLAFTVTDLFHDTWQAAQKPPTSGEVADEKDLIDMVAKEHWRRSCPQDPQPWDKKSYKQKNQHVSPSMWWLSVFKYLGLITAASSQGASEIVDAMKGVLPLVDCDCPDMPEEDSVGWHENAPIPVTFAQVRKFKSILAAMQGETNT